MQIWFRESVLLVAFLLKHLPDLLAPKVGEGWNPSMKLWNTSIGIQSAPEICLSLSELSFISEVITCRKTLFTQLDLKMLPYFCTGKHLVTELNCMCACNSITWTFWKFSTQRVFQCFYTMFIYIRIRVRTITSTDMKTFISPFFQRFASLI